MYCYNELHISKLLVQKQALLKLKHCISRYWLHRGGRQDCIVIVSVSLHTVNIIYELLMMISVVCIISTDFLRNHLGCSECVCQFGGASSPQLFAPV